MGLWWLRYVPTIAVTAMLGLAVAYGIHRAKEQVRAELEPKIEKLEADLAAERADRARAEAATDAYRSEVDALRNRPVSRAPVRLCNETRSVPADSAAQGTDDSTTRTAGRNELSRSDFAQGPDIGPDLYALAAVCDAEYAKLRALQQWIRNDVR